MTVPFTAWLPNYGLLPISYDEFLRIEKVDMPTLPAGFQPSTWSLSLGAMAVYRDGNRTNSLQIREYDTHWTVQLDRFNPDAGLAEWVGHALTDALLVTVGVVGAAAIGTAMLADQ